MMTEREDVELDELVRIIVAQNMKILEINERIIHELLRVTYVGVSDDV